MTATRQVALVSALFAGLAASGCGAPGPVVVPALPSLALTRERYVLPPEPPAPRPSWEDAAVRRALEAEWPPVDALSIPSPPPPDGPRLVRRPGQPRLGSPRPPVVGAPAGPVSGSRSGVRGLPTVTPVVLRASPPGGRAAARVVLVLEPR